MRRLDDVVGADDVDLERLARLVDALMQPQRGEVEDAVGASHDVTDHSRSVTDPSVSETRVDERALEVGPGPAYEVVEHADLRRSLARSWSTRCDPTKPAPPMTANALPARSVWPACNRDSSEIQCLEDSPSQAGPPWPRFFIVGADRTNSLGLAERLVERLAGLIRHDWRDGHHRAAHRLSPHRSEPRAQVGARARLVRPHGRAMPSRPRSPSCGRRTSMSSATPSAPRWTTTSSTTRCSRPR